MRGLLSRGCWLSPIIALLSLLALAGCVPVAPVIAPAHADGPVVPPAAIAPEEPGTGSATQAARLLPAWRDTENLLILGADQDLRSGSWRTDAMLVLGIDRKNKRAALLSLLRDLYVEIPGHGGARINTVDAMGEQGAGVAGRGPALVAQVLEQTLGLRIDHWLRIEIDHVKELVDSLGGISVHLDCPFYEPILNLDTGQWEYLTLPAGDVRMDGETVYWYVRLRILGGDSGRTARQRQLLLALREQVLSTQSAQNLPLLIAELGSMFSTDMTAAQLIDAARFGSSLAPGDIHSGRLGEDGLQLFRTPHGIDVLRIVDAVQLRNSVNGLWLAPVAAANASSDRCTLHTQETLDALIRAYTDDQVD